MNITNLVESHKLDVKDWLKTELQLGDYQREKLDDIISESQYYFFEKREYKKTSFLFRLTCILIPIYFIIMFFAKIIKWIIKGEW
jgi:hypothetical protein